MTITFSLNFVYGLDNNGPLLVVDTECPGTRDYLGQMVRGEIPNCMPELTPKELVNSGFLFGKFIYFNQFLIVFIIIAIEAQIIF